MNCFFLHYYIKRKKSIHWVMQVTCIDSNAISCDLILFMKEIKEAYF